MRILRDGSRPTEHRFQPGPDPPLRYNSRIDRERSGLTLTRPDQSKTALPIDPGGPPDHARDRQ